MIRPISSVNVKSFKQAETPQQQQMQEIVDYPQFNQEQKAPSKAKTIGRFVATQFLAGALFNTICDTFSNGFRLIKKKPLIPAKEILLRSAQIGGLFTVMGFVFMGIEKLLFSKKQK